MVKMVHFQDFQNMQENLIKFENFKTCRKTLQKTLNFEDFFAPKAPGKIVFFCETVSPVNATVAKFQLCCPVEDVGDVVLISTDRGRDETA